LAVHSRLAKTMKLTPAIRRNLVMAGFFEIYHQW